MAYNAQVLADAPLIYWKLEETSGTAFADSSGNGRNGTFSTSQVQRNQSSLLNSTPAGKAALLPASTINTIGQATVGDLTTGRSGLTFEAWIRFGGALPTSSSHSILTMNGNQGLGVTVTNNIAYLGFRVNLNNSSSSTTVPSSTAIALGQTYHYVGVIEDLGSSVQIRQYVNGELVGTSTSSASDILAWAATTASIGNSNRVYSLQIDEPAIYGAALSPARIQAHYDVGSAFLLENTSAPTITGTATVGQTLSSSTGTWSGTAPSSYAYAWESSDTGTSGWSAISGATSGSYSPVSTDAGKYLRSTVTATNILGPATSSSSAVGPTLWAPANTEGPAISFEGEGDSPAVGDLLSCTPGTWTGYESPSISYQWQRSTSSGTSWSNISGETSSSYTATGEDAGRYLRVSVTGTNSAGSETIFSATLGQIVWEPINTAQPSVSYSGVLEIGTELSASIGSWTGFPGLLYEIEWQRSLDGSTGWTAISGAISETYTATEADAGKYLRVSVFGINTQGATEAVSATTAYVSEDPSLISAPTIEFLEDRFEGSAGEWDGFPSPSFSWAWEKSLTGSTNWQSIASADGSSLTITDNLRGYWIRAVVTASNDAGSATAASEPYRLRGKSSSATVVGALMISGAI
jgi:hypothetical protein